MPLLVAPFDAELFGHWWYEGPFFIENILKNSSKYSIKLTNLKEFLIKSQIFRFAIHHHQAGDKEVTITTGLMMQMRGLFRKSLKQAQLLLIYARKILIITYLQDFSSKQQENYFSLNLLIGVLY